MLTKEEVIALRMQRQRFSVPTTEAEYDALFREMSPVPTIYWTYPGSPPTLPLHCAFDDDAYNNQRRASRHILKSRFCGNVGYVDERDLELYACLYKKECKLTDLQMELLDILRTEGAMNIQLMKELTKAYIKNIAPALHKLQEAYLVFEDQVDSEWDRGFYLFEREFPDVDLGRYTRTEALSIALLRFGRLMVHFTEAQAKSFFRLPGKDIREAVLSLIAQGKLEFTEIDGASGYLLSEDAHQPHDIKGIRIPSVLPLQRNDFLVRAYADELKKRYQHSWDALYYLLVDGEIHGAVTGRFRFGPHYLDDVVLDLPVTEREIRREEIVDAIYTVFDRAACPLVKYDGKEVGQGAVTSV